MNRMALVREKPAKDFALAGIFVLLKSRIVNEWKLVVVCRV